MPSTTEYSRPGLSGLYVITDEKMGGGHIIITRAALAGGARIIQLRDKSTPPRQLWPIAREMRRLTREAKALFIVNDRPDLALAFEADGVHLGTDDLAPQDARRVLSPHHVIGFSCGDENEAKQAFEAGADYIGAGAIFGSTTKLDAGNAIGLEKLRAIIAATPLPVAAIGGIDLTNIHSVAQSGAKMACVVSAVVAAGDESAMKKATCELIHEFERNR